MDLTAYIDQYCERTEPGLWAEPLNLLSNASFIVAGLVALGIYARVKRLLWMPVGLLSIGVGSALFHSFATMWAQLADVIPIILFSLVFLGYLARKALGFSWPKVAAAYGSFFLVTAGFLLLPQRWFNGSNAYFGVCVALVASWALLRTTPWARPLGLASIGFALAITCRSIDMLVCPSFPYGTHFLWHALNGWVLYTMVAAALRID